jgi:subtilisin family serine protease
MAYFSSRGPNPVSPDLIKPDVTAPGVHILAGNTPAPISGVPGELFQAIAGTSMSSPHVAGLLALIDQAHPGWSPAQAKSTLMTTAYRDVVDSDRVSTADPFDRGAGHVDPRDAARAGSLFQPGLTYDAGLVDYEAYICGANFGIFPPLYCALLDAPTEAYNLNVPSIGISQVVGSQTVARSVTSVAAGAIEYTAVVEVPEGFNVTVSPNSFTINEGDVQAFEVTITHEDAPFDEWRFGSLTWQSAEGPYAVYSPIAVRAAPAGIP